MTSSTTTIFSWIACVTALVNVCYVHCLDEDFGPFFVKFCSGFPYLAKLCPNGHDYLKRQLIQRRSRFFRGVWGRAQALK